MSESLIPKGFRWHYPSRFAACNTTPPSWVYAALLGRDALWFWYLQQLGFSTETWVLLSQLHTMASHGLSPSVAFTQELPCHTHTVSIGSLKLRQKNPQPLQPWIFHAYKTSVDDTANSSSQRGMGLPPWTTSASLLSFSCFLGAPVPYILWQVGSLAGWGLALNTPFPLPQCRSEGLPIMARAPVSLQQKPWLRHQVSRCFFFSSNCTFWISFCSTWSFSL